ncbi:MAG: hypothetical protein QM657_15595 [Lacrimispora sp.]|uniref:hypothetical protein n=1 Tax=Lacrimispora sp. TaxID=2719234 RepID=UPI0039E37FCC
MIDMMAINAIDVRKDFSNIMNQVVYNRPLFLKGTRDYACLLNVGTMRSILSAYHFTAQVEHEKDGSYTIVLNEIDLVENGKTEDEVCSRLASSILEYAKEFYEEYDFWSKAPNREGHIPYILKALIIGNPGEIGKEISYAEMEII